MTERLRWLLVPVTGAAVWFGVLALGIAGYATLDSLCPPSLVVSGMCTAPWHSPAVEALMLTCTALVSAGVVIAPALIAPSHRFEVAAVAYGCGAAFAIYTARGGGLWAPFFVAALVGSASLWLAASKWKHSRIAA